MKKYIWKSYALFIALVLMFISCSKEEDSSTPLLNLREISSAVTSDNMFKIDLMAEDSLVTGFQSIYFKISKVSDNQEVDNAEFSMTPMMDMQTKKHSAPFENPVFDPSSGYYKGAVVFIMPGDMMMRWSLNVNITVEGKDHDAVILIDKVGNPQEARLIQILDTIDSVTYFVARIEPVNPEVGINPFSLAVYKKASMMSFPADSSLAFTITPEMPSMDHGSPNNVNPVHTGSGHYDGKVNFTMTGWWRVNLSAKLGDRSIKNNAWFDITFQ